MAGVVVVFDFDYTILDCDCDNWVIDEFGGTQQFEELLQTMPWNSAMDRIMGEFHSQGRTIEEIVDRLRKAPLPDKTISAIKSAYDVGCDLRIVSDANKLFIETILKHYGLLHCFSEINTNPSYVDEEGRVRVLSYHDFTISPHGCTHCPPNMCKSKIVERIRKSGLAQGRKRVIYVGDGKGDYCPSLGLNGEDYLMPRKDYALWQLIYNNSNIVKAKINAWTDAEELHAVLLGIIDETISAKATHLIPADNMFQNIYHDVLPKALPVPH